MSKNKPDLSDMVKGAGGDLQPPQRRRGAGLEGMMGSTEHQERTQVDKQESVQSNKSTSTQTNNQESTQVDKEEEREPQSFRMRKDLAKRVKILAAVEDKKIYEIIESALEQYLASRNA